MRWNMKSFVANSFLSARVVAPSWSVIKSKSKLYLVHWSNYNSILEVLQQRELKKSRQYQFFNNVTFVSPEATVFQKDISQQLLNRCECQILHLLNITFIILTI
jgi:hypothetical protein